MKKFYALLAALAVTASAFAAVQRGADARVRMMPRSLVANPIAENLAIVPGVASANAPAIAAIAPAADAADAVGYYKAVFTDADGTYYHYTSLEATGENAVIINGLYYYDAKVPATVDAASGDLVIPSYSVVYDGGDYTVFIAAVSDDASSLLSDDIVLANAGNGSYTCSQYVGYIIEYQGSNQLTAAFTFDYLERTDEINTRVLTDVYEYDSSYGYTTYTYEQTLYCYALLDDDTVIISDFCFEDANDLVINLDRDNHTATLPIQEWFTGEYGGVSYTDVITGISSSGSCYDLEGTYSGNTITFTGDWCATDFEYIDFLANGCTFILPFDLDGAGVSDIAVDGNAPVEYYNLQGVRIANPEAGSICIRRQGSTASKVLVR